jgi:hypothetical protein
VLGETSSGLKLRERDVLSSRSSRDGLARRAGAQGDDGGSPGCESEDDVERESGSGDDRRSALRALAAPRYDRLRRCEGEVRPTADCASAGTVTRRLMPRPGCAQCQVRTAFFQVPALSKA